MKTIELLHELQLSKAWIAKQLDISIPTVSEIIKSGTNNARIKKRVNSNFKRLIERMEEAHYEDVL
jgi:predicted transcriptional regulator